MDVQFDDLFIHLDCSDEQVYLYWQQLFDRFPRRLGGDVSADVCLTVQITDRLPRLPASPPFFVAPTSTTTSRLQPTFSAYQLASEPLQLYFHDGAVVRLPADRQSAKILATPTILQRGRIEDVLMTTLAALLRPRGYYFIHAFAGTRHNQATLLVGESGSGKTTTGLNLLRHGWHYLANDLAVLKVKPDNIYALPSPGGLCIRPKTWRLLPHFAPIRERYLPDPVDGNYYIPASQFVHSWGEAAPVTRIFFPQVCSQLLTEIKPLRSSLTFPRLMGESIDKWDVPTLETHLQMLEQLSKQARGWLLLLGEDVENMPAFLQSYN